MDLVVFNEHMHSQFKIIFIHANNGKAKGSVTEEKQWNAVVESFFFVFLYITNNCVYVLHRVEQLRNSHRLDLFIIL